MADICCYGVRYSKCEWGVRHEFRAKLKFIVAAGKKQSIGHYTLMWSCTGLSNVVM